MEKCCICMRNEKIGVIWGKFMDLFGVFFMDEWLFVTYYMFARDQL